MKFCDERIQKHLLNGGKIKRNDDTLCFKLRHIKLINDELCFANGKNENYKLNRGDLITTDWKIVEPEYNWNKIIKDKILCVFNDYEDFSSLCYVGLLKEFNNENELPFKRKDGLDFRYCKPFNPAEFNIAKDLKEYEK